MRTDADTIERIKSEMGEELLILTHHYQREEIVRHGNLVGDSFVLARKAAGSNARKIVFCGVHFMAESAAILTGDDQQVYLPDPMAGCPMADMADISDVERAVKRICETAAGRKIVPVVYINSNADVKALVGEMGGIACTSANAPAAFKWATDQGDLVLFLPDQYLGVNTAFDMGYDRVSVWNPHEEDGNVGPDELREAQAVVWKGYCHVHTLFSAKEIESARAGHPGCSVVVHPECRPEVVQAADGSGSTGFIVKWVEGAPPGSTIVVGTEVNLVLRLAREYPDRRVIPLNHSLCPNMYRTTLPKLARLLQTFDPHHEMTVEQEVARGAKLALDRMLALR